MTSLLRTLHESFANRRSAWFWLAGIAGLTGWLRGHGFSAPLHTDICVYALIGKGLLAGAPLYGTMLDNKPPGIYLLFMLAIKLFGDAPHVFNLMGLTACWLSQLLIFLILRRLASAVIGLHGALLWGVASVSMLVWANQPHTEMFINTLVLLAVWGLVRYFQGCRDGLWWTGLGLGLASVFKTNVVFIFLVLLAGWTAHAMVARRRYGRPWPWRDLLAWGVPPLAIWLAIIAYFLHHGVLVEFYEVVFKSLHAYAGHVLRNQLDFFIVWKKHPDIYRELFLVTLLGSLAWCIWKLARREATMAEAVLALYGFGCMLMVGALRGLYILYFQIFIPPLVLMTGMLLHELRQARRVLFLASAVLLMLLEGFYGLQYLRMTPDEISTREYGGVLVADRRLGEYLKAITAPKDKLYQWGLNAQLNYYSCRESPAGLIHNHLLDFSPDDIQLKIKNKIFDALMKAPPEIIIFAAWIGDFRHNMFYQALWPQYDYFGCFDKYLLFTRKDKHYDPRRDMLQFRRITEQALLPLGTDRLWLAEETRALAARGALLIPPETRELLAVPGNDAFSRLMQQGNKLVEQGDWKAAMEVWAQAHEIKRRRPEPFANLAIYHKYLGSFYLALTNYQLAYEKLGHPWDAYYRAAQRRMIAEVHALESQGPQVPIIKRDLMTPQGGDAYAGLVQQGNAAAQKTRWVIAKDAWENARALNPAGVPARANLAVYYEIHYQFDEALALYRALAAEYGEPWRTYAGQVERLRNQLPAEDASAISIHQ